MWQAIAHMARPLFAVFGAVKDAPLLQTKQNLWALSTWQCQPNIRQQFAGLNCKSRCMNLSETETDNTSFKCFRAEMLTSAYNNTPPGGHTGTVEIVTFERAVRAP